MREMPLNLSFQKRGIFLNAVLYVIRAFDKEVMFVWKQDF